MGDNHRFAAGVAELEQAEDVVRELHAGCCQPLRSPRMEALSDTLGRARRALGDLDGDRDAAVEVIAFLEDAGLSSAIYRWHAAPRSEPSSTPAGWRAWERHSG